MNPRVSILMPVFNVAPYLREAMDSMLAQTFTDFELIVLDDCTPDEAPQILDTYDDPRIVRYRGEKNVGLGNVLNVGMDMARGEFIARMDGDDISLPDRLEKQVAFMDAHPDIDLCSCAMQLFGAKSEVWVRESDPEEVKITALFFSPILHASSVWRRERFNEANLRFRQEMVPAEDYDMWTRALTAGLKLVNMPEVLYRYRIHASQVTGNQHRLDLKDKEVQQHFYQATCPTFIYEKRFADMDLTELEKAVRDFCAANKDGAFFKQHLLEKRLRNYYQSRLLGKLKKDFSFKSFFKLSLKNQIKYLVG